MIWLGQAAQGRDNNFNLIRMLAATAVLVSHAWPLTYGPTAIEPLERFAGHSLGSLAVYVFFAISGFLITASFTRTQSRLKFLVARALRLLPGLVVSLILVAVLIGPLSTSLALQDYFISSQTWLFVLRNAVLISPQYALPGVFETNPFKDIEGSIWTLRYEVACYGVVFILGILGILQKNRRIVCFLIVYCLTGFATQMGWVNPSPILLMLQILFLPFCIGMLAWVWRERIPLSFAVVVVLAVAALMSRGSAAAYPILIAFLSYTSLWLAYVPSGRIREYNWLGDYSYGMYVYAFPMQGFCIWLLGASTPGHNIVTSLPPTLILAVLSWHLIEKPCLDILKRKKTTPLSN